MAAPLDGRKRNLIVPDVLWERLEHEAALRSVTVSALIRLVLSEWLESERKKSRKKAG